MKVYLDACCLNRPFDDQSQPRVRLEAEAISIILEKLHQNEWEWIGSEILLYELGQNPDLDNRQRTLSFASLAQQVVETTEKFWVVQRSWKTRVLILTTPSISPPPNTARLMFS
jgi:hypothetical protein